MSKENIVNLVIETDQTPPSIEETAVEEIELKCTNTERLPENKTDIALTSVPKESDKRNDISDENSNRNVAMASLSVSGSKTGSHAHHHHQHEHTMAKSQSEMQVCATNSLSVSQTSKNSLMTFSSSGTFYDHTASRKKVDLRITPKRGHLNGKDATDFRQMEQGLLQLLEDFHSGKLEAFGQDCTFERMENVREQQERLARLHFDLNAQQELCGQHSEEGIKVAKRNLSKLTENLQELSRSIEKLQSGSVAIQGDV